MQLSCPASARSFFTPRLNLVPIRGFLSFLPYSKAASTNFANRYRVRPSVSGRALAYRWRSPPKLRRHRAGSLYGTVALVTGAAYSGNPMDIESSPLFPHSPLHWFNGHAGAIQSAKAHTARDRLPSLKHSNMLTPTRSLLLVFSRSPSPVSAISCRGSTSKTTSTRRRKLRSSGRPTSFFSTFIASTRAWEVDSANVIP